MLGKLIKHEFRAVSKVLILINACTVLLSIVGCLTFASPLWNMDNDYIPLLAVSSVVVYYIAVIAISLSSVIYLMLRFYRNLYTDEGYLMHTLPVTPRQLILSKGIAAFCWFAITTVMIICSVISILLSACLKFMSGGELRLMFEQFPAMFRELYGMGTAEFVTLMLCSVIIGAVCSILMIYASISLGQLFAKHKILSSVGCYVLLYLVTQMITVAVMAPYMVSLMNVDPSSSMSMTQGYFQYATFISIAISVVSSIAYYIITEYVMTKKLNLE